MDARHALDSGEDFLSDDDDDEADQFLGQRMGISKIFGEAEWERTFCNKSRQMLQHICEKH